VPAVVLDLVVDPEVRALAPWRAELRRQVARMVTAAARTEAAAAPKATSNARSAPLEVSLRLTDDAAIRELNREFRRKDKATDVLAQREGPPGGACAQLLGDIVISLPTARRQAKRKTAAGLLVEVRFLASHGLCHLLGYDHRDDEEERVMNARMAALLAQASGRGPIRAA
jgi:probable rRNA maturation factor